MIKVIGISIATLLCVILLRDKNKVFAVIVSISGICVLLGVVAGQLSGVINGIIDLSGEFNSSIPYVKIMLKVLGITLSAQIVSNICSDNGENALASITELTAKILIIVLLIPLFETLISIISGLVK